MQSLKLNQQLKGSVHEEHYLTSTMGPGVKVNKQIVVIEINN